MSMPIKLSRPTMIFIGLVFLHLLLTFILPASNTTKATYQIDDGQYYALLLAVRLPLVAVWILLFYSYRWLVRYARSIDDTKEGPFFANIARGVGVIAWGFLVSAIVLSILNAFGQAYPDFRSIALIIGGYVYVLIPLIAFSFIGAGTHALSRHAKVHLNSKHIRILMLVLAAFSVIFCLLVASRLNGMSLTNSYNSHYLPNGLVWTTIAIPYLYAAFLGIFAVVELGLIARRTPGVIYKQGLQLLAGGLMLIIIMLVSLQYFRSVVPRTGYLTLGTSLLTTYGIYAFAAAGSLMLAAGAKRLKKIEDA